MYGKALENLVAEFWCLVLPSDDTRILLLRIWNITADNFISLIWSTVFSPVITIRTITVLRLSLNIQLCDCIMEQHTKVSDLPEIQYTVTHFSCLNSWTQINAGNRCTRKITRNKITQGKLVYAKHSRAVFLNCTPIASWSRGELFLTEIE
jgi:hypothetical protein